MVPGQAMAGPLRLAPLHAVPDTVNGGRIVDSLGRQVLLRGVNVNSLVDYTRFGSFAPSFPLQPRDPARMAALGWNAVRLQVSWSRLERRPGHYDDRYLEYVASTGKAVPPRGIYTIVDFHQDAGSSSLGARPNERCPPGSSPNTAWDGAPAWATVDDPTLPHCHTTARELSAPVLLSWRAFLTDSNGTQTRYLAMVRHVAERFATSPSVAGYDLINEPLALDATEQQRLSDQYARAHQAVRAGEQAHQGSRHLVFVEPSVLWSKGIRGAPPVFQNDGDVVYAPHMYSGDAAITRNPFDAAKAEAKSLGGFPVVAGEWGAGPKLATAGYLTEHASLQDEYRIGGLFAAWRTSCGDPATVTDWLAARAPAVWGVFDVDCSTNTPGTPRATAVRQLARGYVRAAPGVLVGQSFDPANATFAAWGRASGGSGPLVAYHPDPKVTYALRGLDKARVYRAPGGGSLITASPKGGPWTIAAR
jgi:hypothetical protein